MSMLTDKYLPEFHFSEHHERLVSCAIEKVGPAVTGLNFSGSWIIRVLFALRGMPARMMTLKGLDNSRFIILEKSPHELAIGLIGQFWRPSGNLQKFNPDEFISFKENGFCKAVWTFNVLATKPNTTLVQTDTRIYCTDAKALKKFSRYRLFIRPFSGLVRMEILRGIKKKAERPGSSGYF
ncbi:MAG: hypothetical protein KIT62_13390 [Cyclobacteriaceae bacterium]|nr:hypothetical protein [Cyclobacteriaceae bacterium]